jgi:NTE family protein
VETRGAPSRFRAFLSRLSRPQKPVKAVLTVPEPPAKLGLALGGGFARGLAHIGVLQAFQRENIPIEFISGVSAGAIVAAAYASGTDVEEIARIGCAMRFTDVARWSICRLGLAGSDRMAIFLKRLLKKYTFEEMKIPLGVLATDLSTGQPVLFRDKGDVILPIRASCSYPGLFQPIRHEEHLLVDGAITMEVPAVLTRKLGATRVVSVCLPMQAPAVMPHNMFQVVNRCFQILQRRNEDSWRQHSDLVITPDVAGVEWDGFKSGRELIEAGDKAAAAMIPEIREWLKTVPPETEPAPPKPVEVQSLAG